MLIATAASAWYEDAVFALLGSLRLNWPNHPPVTVYDIGMSQQATSRLRDSGICVRRVPPFCLHWRKHFAWKIWCLHDMRDSSYLYLDAGVCVLRPMPEVVHQIESMGYFLPGNGWTLKDSVPKPLAQKLGYTVEQLANILSISGGVHGFREGGETLGILQEAMELACEEDNLRATAPLHRHDQALLSLLVNRHLGRVLHADAAIYAGWKGPNQAHGQAIWVHRGHMRSEDLKHFASHFATSDSAYLPRPLPLPEQPSMITKFRVGLARLRGTAPKEQKSGEWIYDGVRDKSE